MKILHEESGTIYEITELKAEFKLTDSRSGKSYTFNESYEAIWLTIELIRTASFELLKDEDFNLMASRIQLSSATVPKQVIAQLKREKINHTYYDQLFLKLLTSYRCGHPEMVVSNKTNFVISHELQHLLRKLMGSKLSIPTVQS